MAGKFGYGGGLIGLSGVVIGDLMIFGNILFVTLVTSLYGFVHLPPSRYSLYNLLFGQDHHLPLCTIPQGL